MIPIRTIVYDRFNPGDSAYPHSVWENAEFAWPKLTGVNPIIRQYTSLPVALAEALEEPICECNKEGCLLHYSLLFFGSRRLPTDDEKSQISELLADVPLRLQIVLGFTHEVKDRSGLDLACAGVAVVYEVDGFQALVNAVEAFIDRATRPAA